MFESSPRTLPQFLIGIVHFLVASKVAKYKAFIRACELGNTLLYLFNLRYSHSVGTSCENVRYYCKTHGLDGYAEQVKMHYREQRNTPDNCKYCCHDCYIMDRFWSDGDKDRVVAKSPGRKTIKIAL